MWRGAADLTIRELQRALSYGANVLIYTRRCYGYGLGPFHKCGTCAVSRAEMYRLYKNGICDVVNHLFSQLHHSFNTQHLYAGPLSFFLSFSRPKNNSKGASSSASLRTTFLSFFSFSHFGVVLVIGCDFWSPLSLPRPFHGHIGNTQAFTGSSRVEWADVSSIHLSKVILQHRRQTKTPQHAHTVHVCGEWRVVSGGLIQGESSREPCVRGTQCCHTTVKTKKQ